MSITALGEGGAVVADLLRRLALRNAEKREHKHSLRDMRL